MFAYISGILTLKSPTRIVLDVAGLGYDVHIPVSTYEKLAEPGEKAKLLTYLYVREDVLQLFGFSTEDERNLFVSLISVSGVGPRMAQGILSKLSVRNFIQAVEDNNFSLLTQVPGVGNKMAQRLTMELKDKVAKSKSAFPQVYTEANDAGQEAVSALMSLGYREKDAHSMVGKVISSNGSEISLENIVKKALQSAQ